MKSILPFDLEIKHVNGTRKMIATIKKVSIPVLGI